MKNLVNLLIGLSAIVFIIGVISKLATRPILDATSKGLIGLAGVLLLFAIALSVKK